VYAYINIENIENQELELQRKYIFYNYYLPLPDLGKAIQITIAMMAIYSKYKARQPYCNILASFCLFGVNYLLN